MARVGKGFRRKRHPRGPASGLGELSPESIGYRDRGDNQEDGHKHRNRVTGTIKTSAGDDVAICYRDKAVPPGIESKFGPITPDVDTPAEKALPPGIELNVDHGKLSVPETVVPDDDGEQMEPASDDSRQR